MWRYSLFKQVQGSEPVPIFNDSLASIVGDWTHLAKFRFL